MPGCGTTTAYRNVVVTNIAAPQAPAPQYAVTDSPQQIHTFTFDSIVAGEGGDQIEWATNLDFSNSTIAVSPATIQIDLIAGLDTVIYLRSRDSKSLNVSRARSTHARVALGLLSAGLLDKSKWVLDISRSDEFNYLQPIPSDNGQNFSNKWALN